MLRPRETEHTATFQNIHVTYQIFYHMHWEGTSWLLKIKSFQTFFICFEVGPHVNIEYAANMYDLLDIFS